MAALYFLFRVKIMTKFYKLGAQYFSISVSLITVEIYFNVVETIKHLSLKNIFITQHNRITPN